MSFSTWMIEEAFERQDGLCALCGRQLNRVRAWDAHHINGDPDDDRTDNCALLCREANNCHLAAHRGDWNGPQVLAKVSLPFFQG